MTALWQSGAPGGGGADRDRFAGTWCDWRLMSAATQQLCFPEAASTRSSSGNLGVFLRCPVVGGKFPADCWRQIHSNWFDDLLFPLFILFNFLLSLQFLQTVINLLLLLQHLHPLLWQIFPASDVTSLQVFFNFSPLNQKKKSKKVKLSVGVSCRREIERTRQGAFDSLQFWKHQRKGGESVLEEKPPGRLWSVLSEIRREEKSFSIKSLLVRV